MSRTVTAMFDSRSDAEAARDRLQTAGIGAEDVQIMDQSSQGYNATGQSSDNSGMSSGGMSSGSTSSHNSGHGFWSGVKDFFMADEDRYTYEEGVRRGGAVLVARVDEGNVDEAVRILEESSTVDIDEREQSWRQTGYEGYNAETMGGYYGRNQQAASTGATSNEEHIPIVEEQLRVGKREVSRGGARVRSYVVETPVTEQVTLHQEHVNIERRPVSGDYAGTTGDRSALFQEREIEMTETAEEAVVSKEARVTEELVVSKTSEDRTETINDSVRRAEVDVDQLGTDTDQSTGTTGFSSSTDRDRTGY